MNSDARFELNNDRGFFASFDASKCANLSRYDGGHR